MRSAFFTLPFLVATAFPLSAFGQEYYSGEYECESPASFNLEVDGSGATRDVEAWYLRLDKGRYTGVSDTVEWNGGTTLRFSSARLRLTEDGDGISAAWVDREGNLDPDCSPFTLAPTDTPLERYEAAIDLAENGDATAENVRALVAQMRVLPPAEMLPDLDQRLLSEKLSSAQSGFWERFEDHRMDVISNTEIAGDGSDYVSDVSALLEPDLSPTGNMLQDRSRVAWLTRQYKLMANRLEAAGADPLQLRLSREAVCARLQDINTRESVQRAVVATRLPTAFWDREITQQVIDDLRACDASETADWIVDHFPEVLAEGERRAAALTAIDEFASLPPTLKTLADTNGLQFSRDDLRAWQMSEDDVNQLAGGRVDAARDAAVAAVHEELPELVAERVDAAIAQNDLPRDGSTLCYDLFGGNALLQQEFHGDCMTETRAQLEEAKASVARAELEDFLTQAEAADTGVKARDLNWLTLPRGLDLDLLSEDEIADANARLTAQQEKIAALFVTSAEELVASKPGEIVDLICRQESNMPPLLAEAGRACETVISTHNRQIEDARCDARLNDVGADEIADDELEITGWDGRVVEIGIRTFVCKEFPRVDMSFKSGGWFSGGKITMQMDLHDEGLSEATLEQSDDTGIWTISEVKGYTAPEGELPALCVLTPERCTAK